VTDKRIKRVRQSNAASHQEEKARHDWQDSGRERKKIRRVRKGAGRIA